MAYSDNVIQSESGGDPYASNPLSSASGPGGFIDKTWLATIKQARPDLASGMSDNDLLALKTDPALAKQMVDAYAQQNAGVLQANGFSATPGNLYLAHFAGPAGATGVLGSDPATPVGGILGPKAMAANPFLKGMTAGDLVNWAQGKAGGGPAPAASPGPQTTTSAPLGLLASAQPKTANPSQGLLGGLLAQQQPGQPAATQDQGTGLLQTAALQASPLQRRAPPVFNLRRRTV